ETAAADPDRTVPAGEDSAAPAASDPGAAPRASAAAPQTAATPETADLPVSPTAEAAAPDVPATPAAPEAEAEAPRIALAPQSPAPREETPVQAPEAAAPERPQVMVLNDEDEARDDARPSVGTPAGTVGNLAPKVRIGRLPTLSSDTAGAEPAQDPLARYAEPVEVEQGKPLMSIVLIDDGTTPMGLDALEAFPYPITFAVDSAWDGAAEAMRSYRDAGFEVMALANLPEGARPQDTEVTLGTALDTIPEAVAVLEGDRGGLQESRGVSEQVARILADSGHGLVLYPKGLNTGQALAAKEGVSAAVLFRDFDGKGQSATVIRRFLDQAAFKAGQEGAVIMLGRLRPETISALLIWGLQDRANRVAFVPVSQVLQFDAADS
ncbi:MAG: divergent polysaccharide deacetylase family protein, partial [Rhodobacteraceae bacterium]